MRTKKELQDKLAELDNRLNELEDKGANQRLIETFITRIEMLEWMLNK